MRDSVRTRDKEAFARQMKEDQRQADGRPSAPCNTSANLTDQKVTSNPKIHRPLFSLGVIRRGWPGFLDSPAERPRVGGSSTILKKRALSGTERR